MNNEGTNQAARSLNMHSSYLPNSGFNSDNGGQTYTSHMTEPTLKDYENVFGPSARDIKEDLQKYKRHGRWHLPDILKGPNPWLADRIDGLITDATNSPFTSTILPYRYFENVDGKLKWNVWSFDEAMPSRVPYEAAARTLTQTKRSFSGYAVRHGLAITLEHNFMMTPKGRENFQNQLNQLVGSIQYANDLDVHMALILAPSYEKHMLEKFNNYNKSAAQTCREYVDLFGFMQKNQNALDILIEEAKLKLKLWGGPMPNFMLTNSKLTFQLTMTPERTNYITQGIDGVKRLRAGPELSSYRGINIIPSRSFSMEVGQPPRDMMRRRVRVAEYYRIPAHESNVNATFEFYDENRDNFFSMSFRSLVEKAIPPRDNAIIASFPPEQQPSIIHQLASLQEALVQNRNERHNDRDRARIRGDVEIHKHWDGLLTQLGQQMDTDTTAKVPLTKIVAQMLSDDTVYAPFAASLHFDSKHMDTLAIKKHLKQSVCKYPRLQDRLKNPPELCSPLTFQSTTKHTLEYNEAKVMLARLFQRYAAPAAILQRKNNDMLFNKRILTATDIPVGEMYMQPLGAFNEPNHPLHITNMATGKCQNVHAGWIMTEEVLDLLLPDVSRWALAADIAASVNGKGMSKAAYSVEVNKKIMSEFASKQWLSVLGKTAQDLGMYTWSVDDNYLLSNDYLCPTSNLGEQFHQKLREHAPHGIVTCAYLQHLQELPNNTEHPWMQSVSADGTALAQAVHQGIKTRLTTDAYAPYLPHLQDSVGFERFTEQMMQISPKDTPVHTGSFNGFLGYDPDPKFQDLYPRPQGHHQGADNSDQYNETRNRVLSDTEIVIIRPNIEHYMLGIILGLSGNELGNTLWGQTELSVYDDSQHGVWGMSYKYHERAIVFNEKNLIRLWDIAYDGYNGGKDDTYVNWRDREDVNKFKEDTNDLTRDYHGKSMMIMAFVHHANNRAVDDWKDLYKENWPSPILYYDNHQHNNQAHAGAENQVAIPTKEFTVFNKHVYPLYEYYRHFMPNFCDLHQMRKSAPNSAQDDETQLDCLAFQGTMIKRTATGVATTINGSGHHGPDFVGVASIRAGKGYKMNGGITQMVRQV